MRTVLALKRNGEKINETSYDQFDQMKAERAYQNYKNNRKSKPWLKTVPQSVKPSPAYYDLCRFVGVPTEVPDSSKENNERKIDFPVIENDRSRELNYNGQTFTVNQLAKLIGKTREDINQRLSKGWTVRRFLKNGGFIG
ncbi:hypothetical protein [Staphylococcus ratti]|uniref:Phage protein n=1 Tax=Staphylococcus ratti TaxID=2892440 RepID=A0ABY3PBM5_9STAP|nr:hypothetical protein [Staphylococcus ratti]UEX89709.1 hypothetical protein LN051_09080 [Staphylococcus ratti]